MKTYELTYIISPDITSEEAEAKAKEIESLIQGKEGAVIKQLNPIAKTLSYPIAKRASGFFGNIEFQLEPEKLLELKDILVKDEKIVRHMITIKQAAEFKKERRTRTKSTEPVASAELKIEIKEEKEEKPATIKPVKEKVELKDIEHELDEILG